MYRDLMEFRKDTPDEELEFIRNLCIESHKWKGKEAKIIQDPGNKYKWHFEGEFEDWSLLNIGWLRISESKTVKKYIKSWLWEDEDPEESGDLIKSLTKPYKWRDGRITTRWEPEKR